MHMNYVEFEISGDYGLFSDPITRIGGEKFSTQIPSYEAIKGILQSVYWKPTFIWVVDRVRVMNMIQTETKGVRPIKYTGGNDLSYYTYLKNCRYQVRAHFIWNPNRENLAGDRNENKHHNIAKRRIETGGRRDIFLGTRECQGYVEPCVYGEGKSYYEETPEMSFGVQYHGITYPDEAYDESTEGAMTVRLYTPTMRKGEIVFYNNDNANLQPKEVLRQVYGGCIQRKIREMSMKEFEDKKNFSGLREFCGELEEVE